MTLHEHVATPPTAARGRGRRLVLPVGSLLAVLLASVVIHSHDPNDAGTYPSCPFLAITGYYCPGCGTTRAWYALTHGDLGTALARNPLLVASAVWLGVWWLEWAWRAWTGRPRTRMAPTWVLWGLLVIVVGFWVLRNVPGWTWLSPA
ncbi:MAG: DUF2752 domain-containing protein [Micrococcales bacterium]|nr:DUF2752 domain-containing protein [Micrococcales bacterium]